MKKNTKNSGFAITGTLALIALGTATLFGGNTYLADKTLYNPAEANLNKTERNNYSTEMKDNKDHSFVPDYDELKGITIGYISDVEKESLISMYEEEKLARDVYYFLYEKWELQIFENISYSENRHFLAVKSLLDRYEIIDPIEKDTIGKFTIPEMQILYDDLVTQGSISLVEALKVGATIEDLDIYDLNEWTESIDNEDIKMVYKNLTRGSQNHMRSFIAQLESNSGTYTAQFLEQSEIDEILANDKEKGSHNGDFNMQQASGQKNKYDGLHGGRNW